jgi:hypothetical protein
MKRSDFIQLSAFAAAAISLPFLHSCNPAKGANEFSNPAFLSRLFDENTIKEAGKAYLQKAPSEKDESKLIQLLSGNGAIAGSTDETSIHQYLDQKIKEDFEKGNIVLVKGWVLSVTEAWQCGLYYLVNGEVNSQ